MVVMQKMLEIVGGNVPILCKVKVDQNASYAQGKNIEFKFRATNLEAKRRSPRQGKREIVPIDL